MNLLPQIYISFYSIKTRNLRS